MSSSNFSTIDEVQHQLEKYYFSSTYVPGAGMIGR